MITKILKKFQNLISIIISLYYQTKLQVLFLIFYKNKKHLYNETKLLKKNGYIHLRKIIPENFINNLLIKYEKNILKEKNKITDYYKFDIDLENNESKIFLNLLKERNVIDICKDYLGNIGILNSKINYQNENDFEDDSMQPHHDTRGNDLKIYIWLSNYNIKSHPLYYLKGSNNFFKFFITYNHHRRKDFSKEKMDKIYGDKGDVIIFDTHGWHSHVKKDTAERVVLEITLIPKNNFFNSFEKENNLLRNYL